MNNSMTYIIAEAGVNHNGDINLAKKLIDIAADCGANAVKFQTFRADKLALKSLKKATYQKKGSSFDESQYEMLKKLELSESDHYVLKKRAKNKGIDFLSTAFDEESLNFLSKLDVPFFKIPSGEVTNLPFLWKIASKGKPMILSTGMSDMKEIEEALATINHALNNKKEPKNLKEVFSKWDKVKAKTFLKNKIIILHCTSQYPALDEEINLFALKKISKQFSLPVGYSDHSLDGYISIAAVTMGAKIIEKHITLNKEMKGPDHASSLDPDEFKVFVKNIRSLENCLGSEEKNIEKSVKDVKKVTEKQIVCIKNIIVGEEFTKKNISVSRCGEGISAREFWEVLGTTSKHNFKKGQIIRK